MYICTGVASYVHYVYVLLCICTCIEASFHKELGKDLEAHDYDFHKCDDTCNQASVTSESQVCTVIVL